MQIFTNTHVLNYFPSLLLMTPARFVGYKKNETLDVHRVIMMPGYQAAAGFTEIPGIFDERLLTVSTDKHVLAAQAVYAEAGRKRSTRTSVRLTSIQKLNILDSAD